jgi:signal transduction histidine kinase
MPDISTQYQNASAELCESATLRTLNSFAIDLITIPNTEDLFWYVAQNVVGRLNFVDCVIYQATDDQKLLVQVAALGEKNPFGRRILNPLKIPFGQGITGQVAQSREPIIVDDLLTDQNYIEDTQAARSEICVPIVCGNRVVGVIDSEHPSSGAFGATELEVLTTISAMTSAKLELLAEAEQSKQRYRDLVTAHAQISQEVASRKALEAALFSARKLETVGRLTGRFAHEFNNFLTVISGNLEFLDEAITKEPFVEILGDARTAAERGATLIQAMLAFSQRTRLSAVRTNLNSVLNDIVTENLTGENNDVRFALSAGLSDIIVDRELFQTVFLHLINNAQDAMSSGNTVVIETDEMTYALSDTLSLASALLPGRYVRLSVIDDGTGIQPEHLQQIFDPFYSTKPTGAGTGLGLSMALGFMQQSGGTIGINSVVTEGSTFQLYFPAVFV